MRCSTTTTTAGLDIYFVDSLTVETAGDPTKARSALYRNAGNLKFEDVTDKAGVAHPGWGMGACTADVDGDGWEDLYVTAVGGNKFYRNNHDGTFSDVTARAGLAASGWSAGCGFADFDQRWRPRPLRQPLRENRPAAAAAARTRQDVSVPRHSRYSAARADCPANPTFSFETTAASDSRRLPSRRACADPRGLFGLGVGWFDYNEDGWPDLFVANDSGQNFLYQNQKNGTFKEVAFPMGVAVSQDGAEQGCMGVALGSYDNNGRFSLFVTNFSEEYNALYHHEGGHFTDLSFRSKTAASSLPYVGWGTAFFDYDNDGLLDIIAVNGHVYPQLDKVKLGASAGYRQRKLLYHNRGDGTFDEVAAQFGAAMMEERVSRGLAAGDLDNDGRLDIVINDLDGSPQILHNEITEVGNWLIVRLKGKAPNTGAIGAIASARTGTLTQKRLVQSGSSYISQEDKRLHFGLGKAMQVDSLEVTWPDGTTTKRENVKANQVIEIQQGQ